MRKIFCVVCSKRCKGSVLKISEDVFLHKDCFKCSTCGSLLERGGFFLRNNKLFCSDDYQSQFGNKCQICQDFIEGEIITIVGRNFHPSCFKCTDCHCRFSPGDCAIIYQEKYLCISCSQKNLKTQASLSKTETSQKILNGTASHFEVSNGDPRDGSKNLSSNSVFNDNLPFVDLSKVEINDNRKYYEDDTIRSMKQMNFNRYQRKDNKNLSSVDNFRKTNTLMNSDNYEFIDSISELNKSNQQQLNKKQKSRTLPIGTSNGLGEEELENESLFRHLPQPAESFMLRQQTANLLLGIEPRNQYRRQGTTRSESNQRSQSPHFHRPPGDHYFSFRNIPSYRKQRFQENAAVSHIGKLFARQMQPRYNVSNCRSVSSSDMLNDGANYDDDEITNSKILKMSTFPSACDNQFDNQHDESFFQSARSKSATMPANTSISNGNNKSRISTICESPDYNVDQISTQTVDPATFSSRGIIKKTTAPRPMSHMDLRSNTHLRQIHPTNWNIYQMQQLENVRQLMQSRGSQSIYDRSNFTPNNLQSSTSNDQWDMFRSTVSVSNHEKPVKNASSLEILHTDSEKEKGIPSNNYFLLPSVQDWLRPTSTELGPLFPFRKTNNQSYKSIPYSILSDEKSRPKGLDLCNLESYLCESEFNSVLNLTRTSFYSLPEWKRNDLKHQVKLFVPPKLIN